LLYGLKTLFVTLAWLSAPDASRQALARAEATWRRIAAVAMWD
jgi:hypothetical protein